MKICVIIPVHNEEKTIKAVVKEIKSTLGLDVLVIDDGSSDASAAKAVEGGAQLLKNEKNLGKGKSLVRGFEYLLLRNVDAVITMDGDGQHLPEDIPAFIFRASSSQSQIYLGNRMFNANTMPFLRRITNKVMSSLISAVAKQKIPDTQCGFRLIKKEALEKLSFSTSRYETESELLIKAAQLGFVIESVPVTAVYENETSHINPFVDTIRFIKFILPYLWSTKY
jgi:glycosyltransferase involved in cell wall biosynthesis